MMRDDAVLLDIAEAIRRIGMFRQGLDLQGFLADVKTQAAVLYEVAVMGEAVKRLSPEFRAQHPEIPWQRIAGMRDKLIHAYDAVDLPRVWEVVDHDLSRLKAGIQSLIPKQDS